MVSCTVGHPAPPPTGPPVGELWTGTGTTPQHHLFPGTSCSFLCASREQCLRQGCKKAASCLEIPEIIKKAGSVLMPQDKAWPLRCLLSAFLLGRRELLPHSAMGCLNPHGMSTDIGPEEKTWRGEQAPAVAGSCSSVHIQQSHYRNMLDLEGILAAGFWNTVCLRKYGLLGNARSVFTSPFPSTCSVLTPLSRGGRRAKEPRAGCRMHDKDTKI